MRSLIFLLLAAPLFAQLPDAPQPVANHSFKRLLLIDSALTLADATVSTATNANRRCYEADPMFSAHPSGARYFGQMAATTGAITLTAYFLRRRKLHYWWLPQSVDAGLHALGTAQTASNCL